MYDLYDISVNIHANFIIGYEEIAILKSPWELLCPPSLLKG